MIHQFKLNGYNIVLDVPSGSIHVVDDAAFDAIALYETAPPEKIAARLVEKYAQEGMTPEEARELLGEIGELKASGKLFGEDKFAELSGAIKARRRAIKALFSMRKSMAFFPVSRDMRARSPW